MLISPCVNADPGLSLAVGCARSFVPSPCALSPSVAQAVCTHPTWIHFDFGAWSPEALAKLCVVFGFFLVFSSTRIPKTFPPFIFYPDSWLTEAQPWLCAG